MTLFGGFQFTLQNSAQVVKLGFLAVIASFLIISEAPAESPAAPYFHWQPAKNDTRQRPWAIILPGASGLQIFEDKDHYFAFARWLNGQDIDVLLVDFKSATKLLPDTQKGLPGPRIAKIVAHALSNERAKGRMLASCPGVIFGWSLGGEGMWSLATENQASAMGIKGAVGYYPSVKGQPIGYKAGVPVLILQGEADAVTKAKSLSEFVAKSASSDVVVTKTFPSAGHGFDVESLGDKRENLRFNRPAATAALTNIGQFLEARALKQPC